MMPSKTTKEAPRHRTTGIFQSSSPLLHRQSADQLVKLVQEAGYIELVRCWETHTTLTTPLMLSSMVSGAFSKPNATAPLFPISVWTQLEGRTFKLE